MRLCLVFALLWFSNQALDMRKCAWTLLGFEQSQRQAAWGLLWAGLCLMAMTPLVLIGGVLFAVFWRQK